MNRRQAISSMAALTTATFTGNAQFIPTSTNTFTLSSDIPLDERRKQYAICKERGHATAEIQATFAVAHLTGYVESMICKYCGTSYRYVQTIEESNTPQ